MKNIEYKDIKEIIANHNFDFEDQYDSAVDMLDQEGHIHAGTIVYLVSNVYSSAIEVINRKLDIFDEEFKQTDSFKKTILRFEDFYDNIVLDFSVSKIKSDRMDKRVDSYQEEIDYLKSIKDELEIILIDGFHKEFEKVIDRLFVLYIHNRLQSAWLYSYC